MAFSKVIPVGDVATLTLSAAAGKADVEIAVNKAVGGGSVAGVATVTAGAKVEVSAVQLANALFELIEAHSPAGVVLIEKEIQAAALAALGAASA